MHILMRQLIRRVCIGAVFFTVLYSLIGLFYLFMMGLFIGSILWAIYWGAIRLFSGQLRIKKKGSRIRPRVIDVDQWHVL